MKTLALWSPRPQAEKCEHISTNIISFGLPVITINPVPFDSLNKNEIDIIIFVSQHAVNQSVPKIPIEIFKNKTLVAIGTRTAKALKQCALNADIITPPPYNTEALLQDASFNQLTGEKYALICGIGGRNLLENELKKRHKQVLRIECYQRDKVSLPSRFMIQFIKENNIAGIILSSVDITETVAGVLRASNLDYAFEFPVFALSERIAMHAQKRGFKKIFIAEQANQDSLFERIIQWWEGTL